MQKKLVLFLLLWTGLHAAIKAQLIVDTSYTIQELVNDKLLGSGVVASNIQYTGTDSSIGFFYGNTNLGLDSGLLLSTGMVVGSDGPSGPNPSSDVIGTDLEIPGDSYLNALTGFATYDASSIEFDFITAADTVVLEYVFASEEYYDFVCTSKNDAIAILISSTALSLPETNIALVPNTSDPVSVNTINFGDTTLINCPPSNPQYLSDNLMGQTIRFNAFTKTLTAKFPTTCNVSYHLKIVIADTDDEIYDSGIFLKAGGLYSNKISSDFIVTYGNIKNNTLYEGCGSGKLVLDRSQMDTTVDQTIHYTIGGTAQWGVDYTFISDSLFFPAGQDTAFIPIAALLDTFTEGTEQLIITLIADSSDTCALIGAPQQHTIFIKDFIPTSVSLSDSLLLCEGDSIELSPLVQNGVPPYSYSWNHGLDSIANPTVKPSSNTTYKVEVNDVCNSPPASDSTFVGVITSPPLTLTVSNDTTITCPVKDYFKISAQASGGTPQHQYYWSTNQEGEFIYVKPAVTTTYYVRATDSCGIKEVLDSITVTVVPLPLSVVASDDVTINCPGEKVLISATATGSKDKWIYLWDSPSGFGASGQTVEVSPEASTDFIVYVSDACGGPQLASDTVHITVGTADSLTVFASNDTLICSDTPLLLSGNGTGGVGDLNYHWSTSQSSYTFANDSLANVTITPSESDFFIVTVTDSCGSSKQDSLDIQVKKNCDIILPNVITPNGDGINDELVIDNLSDFDSHVLRIYNRWGKEVFRSTNYQNDWYGKGLNNGTYFYTVQVLLQEEEIIKKGFITILHNE